MGFLNNVFGKKKKESDISNLPPPPELDNPNLDPNNGINNSPNNFEESTTNNNIYPDSNVNDNINNDNNINNNENINPNNSNPVPSFDSLDDNIPTPNLDLDIPPPPDFDMDLEPENLSDTQAAPNQEGVANEDKNLESSSPNLSNQGYEIQDDGPKVDFDENTPPLMDNEGEDNLIGEKEVSELKRERILDGKPIFTKVDDYKLILESSDEIKNSLKDCDDILKRLNEIKTEEDREYDKWKKMLLDIYRKVSYIDKTCFKEVN